MKLFLPTLLMILFFVVNANAETMTAILDLTKAENGTDVSTRVDAGKYQVILEFTAMPQSSIEVQVESRLRDHDHDYECLVFSRFAVGKMETVVRRIDGPAFEARDSQVFYADLGWIEEAPESGKCQIDMEKFLKIQSTKVYAGYTSINLPIKAPKGLTRVVLDLQPFYPNGITSNFSLTAGSKPHSIIASGFASSFAESLRTLPPEQKFIQYDLSARSDSGTYLQLSHKSVPLTSR